jgi:GNAT superfamily N-acetyltransferase
VEKAELEDSQIRIEHIKLKDLNDFARKTLTHLAFRDVTPISIIRAQSQTKNPHAHPDDVVLLLAFHQNRCVAYHGLLPGLLKSHGNFSKVYWLVTFFVSPDYRNKGIGKLLVKDIQSLSTDLVTTGITKAAEGVYRSMGFKPLGELPYIQLRLERIHFLGSFFRNILDYRKNKKDKLSKFYLIFNKLDNWTYRTTKKIFYRARLTLPNLEEKHFSYRLVPQLSGRFQSLVDFKPDLPLFFRGIKTINWMLKHRWVVSMHEEKSNAENYYFSTVRDIFRYIALEVYSADEKSLKGFLILSVSSKRSKTSIKILDYHFADPGDYNIVAYFGLKYAKEFLADRIEFPEHLAAFFTNRLWLKHLMKKKKRLYLFFPSSDDSALALSVPKINLDYCDSDTAFT